MQKENHKVYLEQRLFFFLKCWTMRKDHFSFEKVFQEKQTSGV